MTFLQTLNAFTDRAVEKAVGAVDAGACVADWGKQCACNWSPATDCGVHQVKKTRYVYSCFGNCGIHAASSCC